MIRAVLTTNEMQRGCTRTGKPVISRVKRLRALSQSECGRLSRRPPPTWGVLTNLTLHEQGRVMLGGEETSVRLPSDCIPDYVTLEGIGET